MKLNIYIYIYKKLGYFEVTNFKVLCKLMVIGSLASNALRFPLISFVSDDLKATQGLLVYAQKDAG
jgi:hypothetical protein